jgi:hypothetical protein
MGAEERATALQIHQSSRQVGTIFFYNLLLKTSVVLAALRAPVFWLVNTHCGLSHPPPHISEKSVFGKKIREKFFSFSH